MLIIQKTSDELIELVCEAREYVDIAIEHKSEFPQIAQVYYDIANNLISQADKLHTSIVDFIRTRESLATDEMRDVWNYEHKKYIEKYEKAKLKLAMYSKF